jgi:hypothetical protein
MIIDPENLYQTMEFSPGEQRRWEQEIAVEDYIKRWRRPAIGEISVLATARAAKVALEFAELEDRSGDISPLRMTDAIRQGLVGLKRYTPNRNFMKVRLDKALSAVDAAATLAHELGHLAWFDRGNPWPRSEDESYQSERFAEYFCRRMVADGGATLARTPLAEVNLNQLVLFPTEVYTGLPGDFYIRDNYDYFYWLLNNGGPRR